MDIVNIVEGVITKAITSYSEKASIDRRKTQLSLFIGDEGKAECKMLVNYQATNEVKIKSILGMYSLMYNQVDKIIVNSLKKFAKEYNVSDYQVLSVFWLKEGELIGWIYCNGEAKKKIKIEEFIT